MITIHTNPDSQALKHLLARPVKSITEIEKVVIPILDDIRFYGHRAVVKYVNQFDCPSLTELKVTPSEIENASHQVSDKLKIAIQSAKKNINLFHDAQSQPVQIIETTPGVHCWRKSIPIQNVGLYIPGGTAPLFSTILMLAIPARLAGCQNRILCTPPDKTGAVHPAILYTAQLCGITQIYKAGGAPAIGALAYGTELIPKVDKIFGPGNQYVMAAKQLVQKEGVAIDMPAGPSEVLIIADESANPDFIAADLLSQAEHGPDSQVVLLTQSESLARRVQVALQQQISALSRSEVATKALLNSNCIVLPTNDALIDFSNKYAPEHLIVATENPDWFADRVVNAGSVFLGHFTPESAGDYASGTNHTLPTNGFATAYSGVSLDSFVKKVTFQTISESGLRALGPTIETMAEAEALSAHKNAVSIRLKHLQIKKN